MTKLTNTLLSRHKTFRNLSVNSRFYVLTSTFLISILILAWLRISISSQQLFYIRVEQVFGFMALIYWYVALIISPLQKAVGNKQWIKLLSFTRRSIGVSAAYFALLHIVVALWGQLGGIDQLYLLPDRFKWSLVLGILAFSVLATMALTSFDKVINYLTFPRWKKIHQFGYFAATLALLHVWLIGTHIGQLNISIVALTMLLALFGLESLRISKYLSKKYAGFKAHQLLVFVVVWVAFSGALILTPRIVSNYHSERHGSHTEGDHHENH